MPKINKKKQNEEIKQQKSFKICEKFYTGIYYFYSGVNEGVMGKGIEKICGFKFTKCKYNDIRENFYIT